MRSLALILPAVLLTACGVLPRPGGVDCTNEAVASVQLTVQSAGGEDLTGVADASWIGPDFDGDCEDVFGSTLVCGWEVSGLIQVTADAPGYQAKSVEVEVVDGQCHPETEQLTIALDPCPPIQFDHAVEVTTVDADGELIGDAKVEWLPDDGMEYTAPNRCTDQGNGLHYCGQGMTGEHAMELWAVHPDHGSYYDVIDVPAADCGPDVQQVTVTIDREPNN